MSGVGEQGQPDVDGGAFPGSDSTWLSGAQRATLSGPII